MSGHDFWKSAGLHLVEVDGNGWLTVTPDLIRAYLTRPEIHPVEESCPSEIAAFEQLMADPMRAVEKGTLDQFADQDTAGNYRILLNYRDHLVTHGTIEAGYMALFSGADIQIPPVFIDQLVHLMLRHLLRDVDDPMQLRAAELFFREQLVTVGDDQLMLADQEIIEAKSEQTLGGLGQLLMESGTPIKEASLDVLGEENAAAYWDRSERFDMAIDFRFTQPAPDAFGRVLEKWIRHFLGVDTRITAMRVIKDERWSWHIGLDAESTRLLNNLYNDEPVSEDELQRILALYRMEFLNPDVAIDTMRGKPVYLGIAMSADKKVHVKPQNLLTNMPLKRE